MAGRRLTADVVFTVGFLVVAVVVLAEARAWPLRAALFPLLTGGMLLGLTLLKLVLDLARARRGGRDSRLGLIEEDQAAEAELTDVFATASRAEWRAALGWAATFFLMLWLVGALVAVPLFALAYLLIASGDSPLLAGSYALASWVFVYGLFDRLLHIPLPPGFLLQVLAAFQNQP